MTIASILLAIVLPSGLLTSLDSTLRNQRDGHYDIFSASQPPTSEWSSPGDAQIELRKNADVYENKVYMLPKKRDEEVARLHLDKLGVELTVLSQDQADYIGVPVDGPYKPEHYRY